MKLFDRFKVRLALHRAATAATPTVSPQVEHVVQQIIGSGRDWKASPAVKPMEWSDDIARHNAAIDKAALLERLDYWADCLQYKRFPRFQIDTERLIAGGHVTAAQWAQLKADEISRFALIYFACEVEQGYAKRQNVTGLGKVMPQLTSEEIADARTASRLASEVQALERTALRAGTALPPWTPSDEEEDELRGTILEALGGEGQILAAVGGNPEEAQKVYDKARSLFTGKEAGHGEPRV